MCGLIFKTPRPRRVTCGDSDCRKQHNHQRIKKAYAQRHKVKLCVVCGREFRCVASLRVNTERRRVTCGWPQCRKAHTKALQKSWRSRPENKEVERLYSERRHAMLLMSKELERLAGL